MQKDIEYYKNLEKNIKKPKKKKKIKKKIVEKACYKCIFYIEPKDVFEAKDLFLKNKINCKKNGFINNKICKNYEEMKCFLTKK